ncbi:MAG: precorrin-4 C(11)-methyltransferase [Muribaculaceae bacterium]|nr:precorrin-4 C(11)-methyltransferase [Muribaculaceae bacterium]
MKHIIYLNETGHKVAEKIAAELKDYEITLINDFNEDVFLNSRALIFVGALGVCVRMIAPFINDKHTDPAVVCVDSIGRNVIAVLSGHVGGANEICSEVAHILGANPVITTQSDNTGYWALDTLSKRFGWICDAGHATMNRAIATLVNGDQVALLLDIRDSGSDMMEGSLPKNVKLIKNIEEAEDCKMIIAVTPYIYHSDRFILYFRPRVLNLGIGCRRDCAPEGVADYIEQTLKENDIALSAIKTVATIDIKKDEAVVADLAKWRNVQFCNIYTPDELKDIPVPNPSEKVLEVTGVAGVAESCALKASDGGKLILEKQKAKLSEGADFTFAVSIERGALRGGHIEIVGAGPGDPDLVSVRGRKFLERADLILYAGSLVPKELTFCAKPGCTVKSSASMNLEEQFELMREFYDRDKLVVRLHTGDPCIYGAIQEQMAFFDRYGMSYHITPGISSFQAAAAALRSQFTIPEKVQTIILTRGGGRTPMPEKEQLHKLAASQSTMCIYLSAGIVDEVQKELLMAYPPETPVAACYKLTWKEEKIYRGVLKDLARIVHENNLTLTTLLVVGDAIDNREGLSRLYDDSFKHLFRK